MQFLPLPSRPPVYVVIVEFWKQIPSILSRPIPPLSISNKNIRSSRTESPLRSSSVDTFICLVRKKDQRSLIIVIFQRENVMRTSEQKASRDKSKTDKREEKKARAFKLSIFSCLFLASVHLPVSLHGHMYDLPAFLYGGPVPGRASIRSSLIGIDAIRREGSLALPPEEIHLFLLFFQNHPEVRSYRERTPLIQLSLS